MSSKQRTGRRGQTLLAVGAVAVLAAGCGSTITKTVTGGPEKGGAEQTGTGTGPSKPPPAVPPNDNAPKEATIGSTLPLEGFGDLQMKVKVLDYLDPATGGEFDTPESGARFVGVKLRLTNTGQKPFDDSPGNGAKLITNTDEEADATITLGGTCESASSVKIAPGDSRVVCIPFEVPKAQKGVEFQFTLDSGFADDTGQWKLT